jgi:hypothetical protein
MSNTTACPSCQRPLHIPDTLLGQDVKCPACSHTFAAALDDHQPASATPDRDREPDRPRRDGDAFTRGKEDRPRQPRRDEDDDGDRPSRRRYYDDRFDRRSRRHRSDYEPHRGTLILILGVLPFFIHPLAPICGPIAWVLGNQDLKEIRAGRMDPEGEGTTQAGRILGMIFTLLSLFVILVFCLIFGFFVLSVGAR